MLGKTQKMFILALFLNEGDAIKTVTRRDYYRQQFAQEGQIDLG
jgi:hypothetical protein